MKLLQNKSTREIGCLVCSFGKTPEKITVVEYIDGRRGSKVWYYNSLAELNEEWEDAPEEEWQDVLGFEELYQVSSFGNVRTIKKGEAEMSQQENRNGYMTVHLRDKGVERRAMVHRLVAEAFIPNPNGFRDVNHKNGDKSDNRVENLEWTSHADNMTHSFRELGKNVRHIVQLDLDNNFIERWNSIIEASEATGICRTNIGECCRGNRKHTKGYKWKYEEDYKESKTHWMIDTSVLEPVREIAGMPYEIDKEIGNWFDTKEEAEKAVEKLKAWKRLKDFGCRFILDDHCAVKFVGPDARKITSAETQRSLSEAYKLLFGGEE